MHLLEALTAAVDREADNRFAEFMERLFAYRCSRTNAMHEWESHQMFQKWMREHKIYKLKTMRLMAIAIKDRLAAFCDWVNWYEDWRRRAGFQEDGGGGPRHVMTMSCDERDAFLAEMEEKYLQWQEMLPEVMTLFNSTDRRHWIYRNI